MPWLAAPSLLAALLRVSGKSSAHYCRQEEFLRYLVDKTESGSIADPAQKAVVKISVKIEDFRHHHAPGARTLS